MSTKININDHDALNAAFADKVAGWRYIGLASTVGCDPRGYKKPDGNMQFGLPHFTRSMDAVLPWLGCQWAWQAGQDVGDDECKVIIWLNGYGDRAHAFAPTLPHAAVVALLRAKGVTVTEHAEPDKP